MPRKRGQNEGTIYPRKDGTWCAQVTVQGRRLTHYGKTKKECRDWIKQTLDQVESGLSFAGAQITLTKYLHEWLSTVKPNLRWKTWTRYEESVRLHIVPYFGNIKLKDLRPDQIQSLYNFMLSEGKSLHLVRMIHATLHRALNLAVRWGLIGRIEADAVDKPKPPKTEMRVLTEDQVIAFLSVVEGTRYEGLFYLAVTTGMRQGELIGLRWTDLDWRTGYLRVQRQLQRISGQGLVFTEPKSASGRRVVVLGSGAIEKLREHDSLQQIERQFAGERWQDNDLIFPSTIGTPMGPRSMTRKFKETLKKANLPDFRLHDLRHTAATLMLQQGVHPKIVQERLGHSTISMTLDTYSHVLPAMQQDVAEKMDELFTPVAVRLQ